MRYASVPVDGPHAGKDIMPHWEAMRSHYYKCMGWDPETGKPLPETLEALGLGHLLGDLDRLKHRPGMSLYDALGDPHRVL